MPGLEPGEPHYVVFPELFQQVEGHVSIKDAQVLQVALQTLAVVRPPVQGGAPLSAQDHHQVIDQPIIRNEIPLQGEEPAEKTVQPEGAEGGDGTAEHPDAGLLLPAPPEHPKMGIVELVGEEPQGLFGMKIEKIHPVRGGAVRSDQKGQKVLHNLDGQIP
ncbi:MAG: hypothetical protein A4E73_01338 [Syntrophaceae bacterium PtaU1.Bin231]|nr:MAG: hypothetical protein A4E73_01338 [Syntrophaceae bacterium PtaU1.Bin231]